MKVGFIGIGRMGSAMAANLIRTGHELIVFNRTPEKIVALQELGARAANSIAEACQNEYIITMLANDEAMRATAFDGHGIVAALPRDAIHISCSTISVALSEELTQAHRTAGQHFVAAPVFGRPDAAAARQLFVFAAGSAAAIKRATPLFEAIGQRLFVVSETASHANLIKLSGNFLIASVMESVGEALALIGKAGLDRQEYVAMLTSTIFNVPVYKNYAGLIAQDNFEPAGFAAHLGLKDVRLVLSAAEDLRVPMPLASLLRDRFLSLLAHGGDELDWSAIGRLPATDAAIG